MTWTFAHYKSMGKIFIKCRSGPKIKHVPDFELFLLICKFDKTPIKNEIVTNPTTFSPIISLCDLFAMVTILIRIFRKLQEVNPLYII